MVVKARIGKNFEAGADGAALGVVGAVDEAGNAGLNDCASAHAAGLDSDVQRGVRKAVVAEETRGFTKALVEAGGDRILGFTMIGAEAGEVIAVVQTAMLAGMPYTGLRDAIIAHPTMAEGLGALFSNMPAR